MLIKLKLKLYLNNNLIEDGGLCSLRFNTL